MYKVLKFSAEWCKPCNMMKPVFEQVKNEMESDSLVFEDIDIDVNPEMASEYKVFSIPTFIVIDSDGNESNRQSILSPPQLKEFIESNTNT